MMGSFDIFTLRVEGEVAGVIGCPPLPDTAGIYGFFYHLKKEYWNRGIATEAAGWLLEYMKRTRPGAVLLADVAERNTASERILIRLGFEFVSAGADEFERDGEWMAVRHYRRKV